MRFHEKKEKITDNNRKNESIGKNVSVKEKPDDIKGNYRVVWSTLKEFCSETTVHGFRYFTEPRLYWIERCWWLISVLTMIGMCTYVTMSIWTKWREQLVLVTFDDKSRSISTIPFPALTICSTWKFNRRLHVENLIRILRSMNVSMMTPKELNQLDVLGQLCIRSKTFLYTSQKMSGLVRSESIYKTILDVAPIWNILQQLFNGDELNLFHQIFTDEGLCHTFNSLNSREIFSDDVRPELLTVKYNPSTTWNMENGYAANVSENETYPYRVFATNSRSALSVQLNMQIDKSNIFCEDSSNSFYISLHAPDELPRILDDSIRIPLRQDVSISIKPNMIETTSGLRSYPPEARDCYFRSERKLRFFRVYTQRNCEMECLTNYTRNYCGCVRFYMPSDNFTKVCSMDEFECYDGAYDQFLKDASLVECNCLSDCTSITYDIEMSQSQLEDYIFEHMGMNLTFSDLLVSFKRPHFFGMMRSEAQTMSDFLASFGGLLGLFMGFSILSVVELFYYFTLRLFCKSQREKSTQVTSEAWAE